jgi:hypothetical protein
MVKNNDEQDAMLIIGTCKLLNTFCFGVSVGETLSNLSSTKWLPQTISTAHKEGSQSCINKVGFCEFAHPRCYFQGLQTTAYSHIHNRNSTLMSKDTMIIIIDPCKLLNTI